MRKRKPVPQPPDPATLLDGITAEMAALKARVKELRSQAGAAQKEVHRAQEKALESQAFLIGRYVQWQLKNGHQVPALSSQEELKEALDPYLTRDHDRAKFGLPPKEQSKVDGKSDLV